MKNIKTIIIVLCLISFSSCAQMAENQKRHRAEDQLRKKQEEAYEDALNLQRFPNLPDCKGHKSPNWTKVAFDEQQGYCILRAK